MRAGTPTGCGSDEDLLAAALESGVQRAFEAELAALVSTVTSSSCGKSGGAAASAAADDHLGRTGGSGSESDSLTTSKAGSLLTVATSLREQLLVMLGDRLEVAYFRLMSVAMGDGEEDEALVSGEVRELLGERRLEVLPLLLKLIFVETRTKAALLVAR